MAIIAMKSPITTARILSAVLLRIQRTSHFHDVQKILSDAVDLGRCLEVFNAGCSYQWFFFSRNIGQVTPNISHL